jgi:hypothetical protein
MAIVLIIVIAALLAALFFIRMSRGHAEAIASLDELKGRTQPVDLASFRNLIDPAETAFLRENLSPRAFRSVQRDRTLAAAEYVRRIASNAAVLLRLGQAARMNPDPAVARAAQEIAERALAVRMTAMRALLLLHLQAYLPDVRIPGDGIYDTYRRLTDSVALYARLQRPAFSSYVMAML